MTFPGAIDKVRHFFYSRVRYIYIDTMRVWEMDRSNSAYQTFHPQDALRQIPDLIPCCRQIEQRDHGHTLVVHLSGEQLAPQDFGRLAIINGKCRNEGMKLLVQCPNSIAGQLAQYSLDRLIWVEREEKFSA